MPNMWTLIRGALLAATPPSPWKAVNIVSAETLNSAQLNIEAERAAADVQAIMTLHDRSDAELRFDVVKSLKRRRRPARVRIGAVRAKGKSFRA